MRYLRTRYGPAIPELMPVSESFGELDPGSEDVLAPGVTGYRVETEDGVYFPVVTALVPGSGDVGRFLDDLPRDRRVVFPCVISGRLRGMLARRGFSKGREWSRDAREWVEIWERKA